jgi:23S rRNA (uridine2552-2'-O)-methyltransferase
VVAPLIQPHGQLIAVDKLTMAPIPDVQILEGDIYDPEIDAAMLALLGEQRVHWVLSDMAPNLTGHWDIDQPRVMGLAEWSLSFAQTLLQPGGGLLIKLFHGQGVEAYIKLVRSHFQKVALKKPQASRAPSREVYLLAQGYGLTKKISKR